MPRHADGPRPWRRKDSPVLWARTTISGKRWAAATTVATVGGDRERFALEAAALYLDACKRRGARPVAASRLDLTRLVAMFLLHEQETYQGHDEHHVSRFKTDLKHYVLPRWKRVEEITSGAWLVARRDLHRKSNPPGPLGKRSIAHLANTIRHFLRYCVELGAIASAPEIKSPPTKEQRAEEATRAALTEATRDRFLRALQLLGELRAYRIYVALFYSLLRKGELAALTEEWVDWKAATITVPGEHSKSGDRETIDLHPAVRRVLRAEIRERRVDRSQPVFGRFDFHQANTPKLKGGLFGRACLKAGIAKLYPDGHPKAGAVDFSGLTPHHVTRHTGATLLAGTRGTRLDELMSHARWRSSAMADRYLHPTIEAGRRASRRLR